MGGARARESLDVALLKHRARRGRAGDGGRGAELLLVAAVLAGVLAAVLPASGQRLSEVELRAGFLYNFARFVEWPADAGPRDREPFVIAVLGDPGLARALRAGLEGRELRGHPVEVRDARNLEEIEGAHLLWIGEGWEGRLEKVLEFLGQRPVLTVSGIEGFAGRGGIIELYRVGSRFRFSIDEREASRRGFRVSSRLLSLSRPRPASARGRGTR